MAMQSAANLRRVYKQVRMSVLLGVAGAALVGGGVLGVEQAQRAPHGHTTIARSVGPAAVTASQPRGTTPVYLVRTAEQAQALRAWLALGSTGGPDGLQPAAVLLAPSAAEASFARAALQEQRAVVFAGAASSEAAATVTPRRPATTTVYRVRTPEEEQTLRSWLAQGAFGVPAGAAEQGGVILAPSAAEADFARETLVNSPAAATPTVLDGRTIQGS